MIDQTGIAPRSILVTGASGFVGRHLVAALARVVPSARLHTARFDITDAASVTAAVRAARPDASIHLAGVTAATAARRNSDRAWDVNLHGSLNLGRAILAHAPGCRMVFASTADAYGASFNAGLPLDETAPLAPMNAYSASKAAADLALGAMAADGLRVVRVRAFNHAGPGQSTDFVVAAFAEQIMRIAAGRQNPLMLVGALEPQRDFLDVRDVCAAYIACVLHDLPPGLILNIASGVQRRVGDILAALLSAASVTVRVQTDPARLRATDIAVAAGDASQARILLGWRSTITFDQMIHDVVEDWRARVTEPEYQRQSSG